VSTASVVTPYRALFAVPVLRRLAVAGLAVAGYTLGQAVTGPARGRLADRHGLAWAPVLALGLSCALAVAAATCATAGTRDSEARAGPVR